MAFSQRGGGPGARSPRDPDAQPRPQLADIGYSTYTRVNALWLDPDDCANATQANCQEGLTLAHAKAWSLIAASPDTGALGYLVRRAAALLCEAS